MSVSLAQTAVHHMGSLHEVMLPNQDNFENRRSSYSFDFRVLL